ncbi:MAG: multidrug effflux MFS transporter [Alphaproteobacteria bacterium]|nr:multidrug effflux MFS transporter [Alphaproteobacteria bacterium]
MTAIPPDAADALRPQSPGVIFMAILVAATALSPMAIQIFLPALPAIQAEFGVSAGAAQLTLSLSMVAIALATLAYGPLSDRFGRRPVMLTGIAIFLAGSLLCTLASSVTMLIIGRIIQAAGGTCGIVLSRAIVRDVFPQDQVARVIAYITVAMVVAPMLSPAVGGVLTDYVGWRANFAFVGSIGIAVLIGVWLRLAETNEDRAPRGGALGMIGGFAVLLRSPLFNGYALQSAFLLAVFFTYASAAPYLMVNVLGRPATEYGLYFILVSLGFMAGNVTAGRLSAVLGINRLVIAGTVISLLATLVAAGLALSGIWSPLAIFGPGVFIAFGGGVAMPNSQAGALNVNPKLAGTAAGLSGFLQMLIAAIFAQTVGHLQNGTPYPMIALMLAASLLALISIILGWRYGRERHFA